METWESEFRKKFKPLLMAINLLAESEIFLMRFITEGSSNLSDSQRRAILGQIECVRGVLELVRQQLEEPPFLPHA